MLRSLQKHQGSGIAEQPLGRVDGSCEVCARTGLTTKSRCAAGLIDAGQRCEMSLSFGNAFSVNHAVRAVGNILIYFYHTGKNQPLSL